MSGYRFDDLDSPGDRADRERYDEHLEQEALDRKAEKAPAPESLADFHRRQGDRLERLQALVDAFEKTVEDELRRRGRAA